MDKNNLRPPRKDFADQTHEYSRDVAKAITLGLANPLVDFVLPSFHQKRFEEWCENVFQALMKLSEEKISLDDLQENEEFISLLKESMVIASKTHQEEKHEFLKRALLNQFGSHYSFDEKIIFTRLIDSLTLGHIYLLQLLLNYSEEIKGLKKFSEIVEKLKNDELSHHIPENTYRMLLNDLERSNLIELSESIEYEINVSQAAVMSLGGENPDLPYILITEFGSAFVEYVMNN